MTERVRGWAARATFSRRQPAAEAVCSGSRRLLGELPAYSLPQLRVQMLLHHEVEGAAEPIPPGVKHVVPPSDLPAPESAKLKENTAALAALGTATARSFFSRGASQDNSQP